VKGALLRTVLNQKLRALELDILSALDNGYYYGSRYISEYVNLHPEILKAILKQMRLDDLVSYHRGLMNDDGEVCGAGHGITMKGRQILENSRAAKQG